MELAFTGGFAWAAWQVLGRLQRHVSKVEKNIDDARLLADWDSELKAQADKKQRSSAAMGQGATASGHDHIFEEWRNEKLRPTQIVQLTSDLAELAQWAGAGNWVPELRGDQTVKSFAEHGPAGKVHLLQAVDTLEFNFADIVKRNAEDLAGNWLWQVTEALPGLSAEPVRSAGPMERLKDLKTRLTDAESAVRAAFDSERRSQATSLKGLVQPLAVAACMRKLQMLKVLSEDVGLTVANSAAAAGRVRAELKAALTLAAGNPEVAAQKAAAGAAMAAEADAAVAAERTTRMAQIDAAAVATYRRVLTLQASSPTHWHASSSTPALHRLGLLAALLAELACNDAVGTQGGAAAAEELAEAVRKLTPQMRVELSNEQKARENELLAALTPAPPPPPASEPAAGAAPADADADANEEAEASTQETDGTIEGEVTEAPKEAVPAGPTRPPPGAAAVELQSLLEGAIRAQLEKAREERKAERAAAREAAKAAKAAAAAEEAAASTSPEAEPAESSGAATAADTAKDAADGGKPEGAEGSKNGETVGGAAAEAAADASAEETEGGAAAEEAKATAGQDEDAEDEAAAGATTAEVEAVDEGQAPAASATELPAELATAPAKEATTAVAEEEEEEEEEPPTAAESVDVVAVQRAVEGEARARADAEKETAILKLEDAMAALRASIALQALKTLVAKVTGSDVASDDLDVGTRLLAIESLFRDAAGAPTDSALAAAVADAAAKMTAADRAALDTASTAAVRRLEVAAARLKLTADVARLDMGPGCSDVLRRTDEWLAQQQEAVAAAAVRAAARAAKAAAKAEAIAAKAAAQAEAAAIQAADEPAATSEEKADGEGEADAGEKVEEAKEEEGAVKEQAERQAEEKDQEDQEVEEEEEAGPTANPVRLAEGRQLASELLSEGLVILELPSPSNRKLQLLRESVDGLEPVDGDGVLQNRLITTLKEVVGQLGPIGGSVDARLSQVLEEADRERLLKVRSNAMAIYSALTAFLRLETDTWEGAKADFEKTKKAVYGIKIERRAESLAAGRDACGSVSERCAALARAVLGLISPAGKEAAAPAKAALQETAEQAQALSAALNDYLSYVRLREHALGIPITSKPELDDDCELSLPTYDELTSSHGSEVVWLDLAGLGLPQAPLDEREDEEDEGDSEDKRATEAAQEKAVEELQERLNEWHTTGLRLLSRGQAALVTLGGLSVDGTNSGELRLSADLGLPSAKSLLQLGAEKLARLQLLAAESVSGPNSGVANPLHWYLLVAPSSVGPLEAVLQENDFFGLLPSQVHVYGNEVRPPLMTEDFKVVLDSSGCRTARSQAGSGEVFLALRRCGALSHMRRVGVRCLEVDTVEDNLFGRPLDPAFLGACAATAIDSAAKVAVPGVQTEGPSALPELYSRYLELLGGDSPLLESLGNAVPALGSYYFSMDFVRRVEKLLREQPFALYRLAPTDKVPTRGSAAAAPAAAKPGVAQAATPAPSGGAAGYRLERRLSDFASPAIGRLLGGGVHLAMVAVDAGTEFAPVWGAAPFYRTASPKAAVDALLLQHTRWVEDSGGALKDEEEGVVEVSPLVSYAGEGLQELVTGKVFEEAYVHELQGFAAESTGTASNLGVWAVPAIVLYSGITATKLLAKVIQK